MVDLSSGIWLYLTILLSAGLLILNAIRAGRMKERERMLAAASILVGILLFIFEGVSLFVLIELEIGVLTFNGLLSGRSPTRRSIYVVLSLIFIALIHWIGFVLIGQAMLIGILGAITNIKEYKSRIVNRRVEIDRDIFHAGIGVLLMLLFHFESSALAITILILMILGGIFAISVTEIFKEKMMAGVLYRFERNGASLGYGAMWLALGSLVAISFLHGSSILVVFAAIFIGDPVATIVGLSVGGPKLPYNSGKSVSGTVAYFIVTAALAYMFIGSYAVLIGLIAAIVESLRVKIDDNITVSAVLTGVLLLLGI